MAFVATTAIFALAACIQAVVGIGFGMVAGPLLALISLDYVPVPLLITMTVIAIAMLVTGWRDVDRAALPVLIPGLAVGSVFAALLLSHIDRSVFGVVFGLVILMAITCVASGVSIARTRPAMALASLASGIAGTLAGLHGIPLAVFYESERTAVIRATIAAVFLIGCLFSLVALAWQGHVTRDHLTISAMALPGLALGFTVGRWLQHKVPDNIARLAMLTLAGIAALTLIMRNS